MLLVYLGSLEKLWLAGHLPQFRQSWKLWNTKVSRIPICSKYFQVSYAYTYICICRIYSSFPAVHFLLFLVIPKEWFGERKVTYMAIWGYRVPRFNFKLVFLWLLLNMHGAPIVQKLGQSALTNFSPWNFQTRKPTEHAWHVERGFDQERRVSHVGEALGYWDGLCYQRRGAMPWFKLMEYLCCICI